MNLGNLAIKQALIKGDIEIRPFNEKLLQSNSYDIRLGKNFARPISKVGWIDPTEEVPEYRFITDGGVILKPGEFALGVTKEWFHLKDNGIMAYYHGTSTLGRIGIASHVTAGLIDTGFKGHITLELVNHSNNNILLMEDMVIGQVVFQRVWACTKPYSSDSIYNNEEAMPILPKLVKLVRG